jgi:hypothetical protein
MGDLIAVNVEQCSMCVILATPYKALSSQILVDTEAIMATLNIQSLRITSPTPGSSKSGQNNARPPGQAHGKLEGFPVKL